MMMSKRRNKDIDDDAWADLHIDLLRAVGKHVDHYDDYVRMQAVCKEWKRKLPKYPKHLKNLWLGFVYEGNPFYSVGEEKLYSSKMVEGMRNKVVRGSYGNWLVTIGIKDGEIEMLNPFTRAQVSGLLPPVSTVPEIILYDPGNHNKEYTVKERLNEIGDGYHPVVWPQAWMHKYYFSKIVLSSAPQQDEGFMAGAMILYGTFGRLAYCQIGGSDKWVDIGSNNSAKPVYRDAIFHRPGNKKMMIYAVNTFVELCVIDPESGNVVSKAAPPIVVRDYFHPLRNYMYVVHTPQYSVILVVRHLEGYRTTKFDMFKRIDDDTINNEGWSRVNDLGDYVLMLGLNSSACLLPHGFPDTKGNRIYYTNDKMRFGIRFNDYDIGYFSVKDGTTHQIVPCSLLTSLHSDLVPPAPFWLIYNH
ncbi:unnamed protein product [Cuscuta epithymum]|uniref:KIB1-4 beta-propeller domain-containing protein n=1 Tax=Cuscuta epithymum TaxID=186058 RepID=A0AAV0EKD3_9ASTE|nr:unnamed protein product [Cuscuta epithymum]